MLTFSRRKMEPATGQLGQLEKAITVYGQPENCSAACKRILEVMEEEAKSVGKEQEICLKVLAHNNLIGRIIGKQGATIKKIMEVSDLVFKKNRNSLIIGNVKMTLIFFQDTSTKITVSSISDVSSFNPERVISIRGTIPSISKAEAEVNKLFLPPFDQHYRTMIPPTEKR